MESSKENNENLYLEKNEIKIEKKLLNDLSIEI